MVALHTYCEVVTRLSGRVNKMVALYGECFLALLTDGELREYEPSQVFVSLSVLRSWCLFLFGLWC